MCPANRKGAAAGPRLYFSIYIQDIKSAGSEWTYSSYLYPAWNQRDEGKLTFSRA
jgi:hypothetical protein